MVVLVMEECGVAKDFMRSGVNNVSAGNSMFAGVE